MNLDLRAVQAELHVYENAVFYQEFTLKDSNGSVVDITGWTGEALAVTYVGGALTGTFEVSIVNGTSGIYALSMDENSTNNLSSGAYDVILTSNEATPAEYAVRYGQLVLIEEASYGSYANLIDGGDASTTWPEQLIDGGTA